MHSPPFLPDFDHFHIFIDVKPGREGALCTPGLHEEIPNEETNE